MLNWGKLKLAKEFRQTCGLLTGKDENAFAAKGCLNLGASEVCDSLFYKSLRKFLLKDQEIRFHVDFGNFRF